MTRGNRRLQEIRPARFGERRTPRERQQAPVNEEPVPVRVGPVRARMRDAWISISATSPWTSGSRGASSARMRPIRSASSHSAGLIQSSPAVAEYPSLNTR